MELLIFIAGYATGVVSVFVAIWTGMRLRDRKPPPMTWPDVQRHIEEGRAMAVQGGYRGKTGGPAPNPTTSFGDAHFGEEER